MVMQGAITFRWEFHRKQIVDTFKTLSNGSNTSDVTLVCDDQKFLQAHKIVLSTGSPVLRNILISNPHTHPLIFLRGVKYQELQHILQFLYLGETTVQKDRLEPVLEVAKQLQVKFVPPDIDDENTNGKNELITTEIVKNEQQNESTTPIPKEENEYKMVTNSTVVIREMEECEVCHKRFNNKSSLIKHETKKHNLSLNFSCRKCDFRTGSREILNNHRESEHASKYSCNQCNYQSPRPSKLEQHIKNKHLGIRYPCNECEYKATKPSHLKSHIEAKHEDIKTKYNCDQCTFQARSKGYIKTHYLAEHEGIRLTCEECGYVSKALGTLNQHKKVKHEGFHFLCVHCGLRATSKIGLQRHLERKHRELR